MSKRRMFDIDFPSDTPVPAGTKAEKPEAKPSKKEQRRGPMATAITENADALRARAEAEKSIRAENDRLAHEFVRLKKLGLVVDRIPLDQIKTQKLTRDRSDQVDPELDELKESIRSIGLSNPIRVEEGADGYELVQGFRRLSAYRALYEETGDEEFATVPAGLVAKGETLTGLYRRMVDENLVRRDISFAEMAKLAWSYAEDPQTETTVIEEAVNTLFASAGRQKRIYIRNFVELLQAMDGALAFPEALPRALGLDLRRIVLEDTLACNRLREGLIQRPSETADGELRRLRDFVAEWRENASPEAVISVPPRGGAAAKVAASGQAKTTLRCTVPAGTVRCQARDGKVEIAMDRDFSAVDQQRLEAAILAFFHALGD